MAKGYWVMVHFYRNFDIPQQEYKRFKREVRITAHRLLSLSLQGKILDFSSYPDTETVKDAVLDARVLDENNLRLVVGSLDGTKYLACSIKKMPFE